MASPALRDVVKLQYLQASVDGFATRDRCIYHSEEAWCKITVLALAKQTAPRVPLTVGDDLPLLKHSGVVTRDSHNRDYGRAEVQRLNLVCRLASEQVKIAHWPFQYDVDTICCQVLRWSGPADNFMSVSETCLYSVSPKGWGLQ